MKIRHYTYKQINIEKYDECIKNAINTHVYAFSWYLDIVTNKDWEVLVLGDYKAVMPVPYKRMPKKFFRRMVEHPLFCQQLGIFYKDELTSEKGMKFIHALDEFPVHTYNFNSKNTFLLKDNSIFTTRVNLELLLNTDYQMNEKAYSKNIKRNIKKGIKNNLEITEDIHISDFLVMKKQNSIHKISNRQMQTIKRLTDILIKKNIGGFYGAKKEKKIIAIAFFIKTKKRIVHSFSVSDTEGKKYGAMPYLFNFLIEKNANTNTIFDFEGSMTDSIARFFRGFGAENNPYVAIDKTKKNVV